MNLRNNHVKVSRIDPAKTIDYMKNTIKKQIALLRSRKEELSLETKKKSQNFD